MAIIASLVKELRERTGAGMMECKKALVATEGDIELAIENLRKTGLAKADKKSARVAAEGIIMIASSDDSKVAAMVEINSETDFVAKNDDFKEFATKVAKSAVESDPQDIKALSALEIEGVTVEVARQELIAKLGENMTVRRFVREEQGDTIGHYLHGSKIGVLVALEGGDADLAKDIAMHIAASNPSAIDESGVSQDLLDKEKAILIAQAKESGKPDDIIEKMIVGRVKKFIGEITLLGQNFVKDPDKTVAQLLSTANAKVLSFTRLEVGEGIEKKQENFAEEVMAQIK